MLATVGWPNLLQRASQAGSESYQEVNEALGSQEGGGYASGYASDGKVRTVKGEVTVKQRVEPVLWHRETMTAEMVCAKADQK